MSFMQEIKQKQKNLIFSELFTYTFFQISFSHYLIIIYEMSRLNHVNMVKDFKFQNGEGDVVRRYKFYVNFR